MRTSSPLGRDEAAEKPHDRRVIVPAEAWSAPPRAPQRPAGSEYVDSRRNDARGPRRVVRLRRLRLVHRLAEGDPARGTPHHAPLEVPKRRRIRLHDVLKRRRHDARARRRGRRHLRARGHVRLLPDVHDIPRAGQNRAQPALVVEQVRNPTKPRPNPCVVHASPAIGSSTTSRRSPANRAGAIAVTSQRPRPCTAISCARRRLLAMT